MQVQRYDADTFVIRQSVKTNFEAPFLYLLFGKDRALLLDTGAGGLQVRPTIDGVIADWLKAHHRASIPLVVAHTPQPRRPPPGRPGIQGPAGHPGRVGWTAPEVAAFFKIADWPRDIVKFDLGRPRARRHPDARPPPVAHHDLRRDDAPAALRRHPLSGPALCAGRPVRRPIAPASTASSPSPRPARSATSWAPTSR